MKSTIFNAGIVACIIATIATGCGKSESTNNSTPADTKAANSAASSVTKTANDVAEAVETKAAQGKKAVKTTATQAAQSVQTNTAQAVQAAQTTAKQATSGVSDQVQGVVDKAKNYIANGQYRDALNSLNSLMNT